MIRIIAYKLRWGAEEGGREVKKGGDLCIPMADSCCCKAETNTVLYSNYPPIKNKYIFFLKKKTALGGSRFGAFQRRVKAVPCSWGLLDDHRFLIKGKEASWRSCQNK